MRATHCLKLAAAALLTVLAPLALSSGIRGATVRFEKNAVAQVVRWPNSKSEFVNLRPTDVLYVNDKVRVLKGSITIVYRDGTRKTLRANEPVRAIPLLFTREEKDLRGMLDDKTVAGAKAKGPATPIIYPGNSVPVPVNAFEIDLMDSYTGDMRVRISRENDSKPFFDEVVAFTNGRGASESLSAALVNERKSSTPANGKRGHDFVISVGENSKAISVMKAEDEIEFAQELSSAALDPDPILRSLRKTEVLRKRHLFLLAKKEMLDFEDLVRDSASQYLDWTRTIKKRLSDCSLLEAGHDIKS